MHRLQQHLSSPRDGIDVEHATLEWIDWFNHRRLPEPIGHIPPAEAEARSYDQTTARCR